MKVLMFGWEFPPHITGGLGTACYGLTRAMAQEGVDVQFVVPKTFGQEDQRYVRILNASEVDTLYSEVIEESLRSKFSFIEVDSNLLPYASEEEFNEIQREGETENLVRRGGEWYRRFSFSGRYGDNLMEEVVRYAQIGAQIAKDRAGTFDVIHAHDWLTYMAGIAAKEVSGKPLVIHVHATEYDRSGSGVNPNVFQIEQRGMIAADGVITVSNLTRKIVVEKYGIDASKVFTVHNAVHFTDGAQHYDRAIKDKVVTFLGRITYQKGPEYFVEAAAKVLKRVPNVRFVMAGSGDMLNGMIRRTAKLGICDRFHFTGFLKGPEVGQMFSLSDVYVMPSVSEPFGISPLEAMKSNVPVIISKQSGVAEILRYAIKVNYWDVDALADAIYGLVTYPGLSEMFVANGQQEVTALKWNGAARKIVNVYQGVCK